MRLFRLGFFFLFFKKGSLYIRNIRILCYVEITFSKPVICLCLLFLPFRTSLNFYVGMHQSFLLCLRIFSPRLKVFPWTRVLKEFTSTLLSGTCIISFFTFGFLIHLEFILECDVRNGSIFIFLQITVQLFQCNFLKK